MQQYQTPLGSVDHEEKDKWDLVVDYMQPIIDLWNDSDVTEIRVNRYDQVYVEKNNGKFLSDCSFKSEVELERFIHQLALAIGQENLDWLYLDARLPDQSRVCATSLNLSPFGTSLTLRKAPKMLYTFDDLVNFGSLTKEMKNYLQATIEDEKNFVVSGGTGSGKTTIVRGIAGFIPKHLRVITCEDTVELKFNHPDSVNLEAARKTLNKVTLPELIKITLRMSPEWLIVGEIRDEGACDEFIKAINTGHMAGSTIHANSCQGAVSRMSYLIANQGGVSDVAAENLILHSVHTFIHCAKTKHGRKITSISEVQNGEMVPVFQYDEKRNSFKKANHYLTEVAV